MFYNEQVEYLIFLSKVDRIAWTLQFFSGIVRDNQKSMIESKRDFIPTRWLDRFDWLLTPQNR